MDKKDMEKTNNIIDVVIYARFSSLRQNETSIEAQVKECYKYCEAKHFRVIEIYEDDAKSAKTDDRPDFQRLINDSKKGLFQGVVCYQLDRFARNRKDSVVYKAILKKNGVKVYSAKENIGDDPSSILVESVLEGMAEYYSAELAQKVNRNMRLNAEKGFFNGGFAPLGYKVVTIDFGTYKKKKLEIEPVSAEIVKEIFELRANETKIDHIIDILNHKGYKNINGKEFTRNSLQTMLKNKRYIGTNMYGNEEFPNTVPAIIDKELFDRVQKVIEKNKKGPGGAKAKEEYLLTSKMVCDCCGEKMKGVSGKAKNGSIYRYYTCKTHKGKKKCQRKNLSKDYIENLVINKCKQILNNDENIDFIAKQIYEICQKENNKNLIIKEYEKRIKKSKKAIENLLSAIENGDNVDLINERIREKRKELEETEVLLLKEKNKLANINEEHIRFFLHQIKNGDINDIKYRKKLINIFVNEIHVTEKDIIIVFNVSKQKISLAVPITAKENIDTNTFLKGSYFNDMVSQEGFEPPTLGLEGQCSIQLSY